MPSVARAVARPSPVTALASSAARAVLTVAVLVAGGLFAMSGHPSAAADQPPWSLAPSSGSSGSSGGGSGPAGDGRPYVYLEGTPGTVLEDKVTVTNPGDKPRTVELRGADAYNKGDGSFAIRPDRRSADGGAWVRLAERKVTVPPRTRAEVPFTVTVPAGAAPGDHPAAIVAKGAGESAGVRLHLRVSGPTLSALTVERARFVDDGSRITYDLVNRGNTVLSPKLAVHAEGVFGEVLDRGPRALPVELLPGRRVTLSEPWPDAPALDSVDIRLTVTAAGGAHDTTTTSAGFVPWGAVAGAAAGLAAVAGAGVRAVRRRRRAADPDHPEQQQTERELTGAAT
ncbi:hypothetical protein ACFQVC_37680 [Streptomyces monticola]|uniref:DUF916 domain-containing protein n=1 Tax=Streptomyces monticola TaxID=2666263 RepID=A0ABW2JVF5_9ACTN